MTYILQVKDKAYMFFIVSPNRNRINNSQLQLSSAIVDKKQNVTKPCGGP